MSQKSTIVRFLKAAAPISSAIMPNLAARWLEHLFLTPQHYPMPTRELAWLGSAERSRISFDSERKLPVYSWGAGPTVLLVHGWSGRGSQMGSFVDTLIKDGFRVVTFDAPAHGRADGRLSGLPEMAKAIEAVAAWAGPISAIVAHSLGTAAATLAISRGLSVERLVYIAPPENPGDYLYRVANFLGFSQSIAERTRARIEGRFSFPFDDARGSTLAHQLDVPLLVIHDRDDPEVPHEEGARLVEAWPGAALMTTTGLGHSRIIRAPAVVNAVVSFLCTRSEESPVDSNESLRFNSSYLEQVELADGRALSLRLLQPSDKEQLLQGLERLSPESRYMRFMGVRNGLNEATLRYLCEIDGFNHFAMGAVLENPDGSEEGAAVARFVRSPESSHVAELAITVIDDYQGKGLGRKLLQRLIAAALERGVERFHCEFLPSNRKIRALLADFEEGALIREDASVVTMEFDLERPNMTEPTPGGVSETPVVQVHSH